MLIFPGKKRQCPEFRRPQCVFKLELLINEDGGNVNPDEDEIIVSYIVRNSYVAPRDEAGPYLPHHTYSSGDEDDPNFKMDLEWIEDE